MEHNSGYGYFSARLAKAFPNATAISIEPDSEKVNFHVRMLDSLGIDNNAVCLRAEDSDDVFKKLYDSPEFFRFQMMSNGLDKSFAETTDLETWGTRIGKL